MTLSTKTSIFVKWTPSNATEVPILGYRLYMSEGTSQFKLIYNNSVNPLINSYNVTALTTGKLY
jgi:hypothetical protein